MGNLGEIFTCRDCGQEFNFSEQDQIEFARRGFRPPARCPECHRKRTLRRDNNRKGCIKTYTAVCSECGKQSELSFKPEKSKPVYCSECFKIKSSKKEEGIKRDFVLRERTKDAGLSSINSELESSFDDFNLDPRLMRAINATGYDIPTPVQAATIPIGLKGTDIIGTAQTGTGKTAAFVLPILQHLLDNPSITPATRAVVLTPTRELAEQICESFRLLGRFTRIRTATVYGGVRMNAQEQALRSGVDIIVACPGRLLDLIGRGYTDFTKVDRLVIDEADRMLDMGFLPSIKRVISYLPVKRQSMLFSATFAPELTELISGALNKPQRIDVGIIAPAKTVSHALYPCPQHLKISLLLKLLDKTDANSVLIFTRTKHRANQVAKQIEKAGYGTTALHSNKSQNQRQEALGDFKTGRCQIMVATDIAARGLDVETISHVINYDIPDTADTYIHRIGRTGRAEREGDAITLVSKQDVPTIWEIEKTLGSPIKRVKLDDFDYDIPAPIRSDNSSAKQKLAGGNNSGRFADKRIPKVKKAGIRG